jgi:hypothetical protein
MLLITPSSIWVQFDENHLHQTLQWGEEVNNLESWIPSKGDLAHLPPHWDFVQKQPQALWRYIWQRETGTLLLHEGTLQVSANQQYDRNTKPLQEQITNLEAIRSLPSHVEIGD